MVWLVLGQRGSRTDFAIRSQWCHESDLNRARWIHTAIDQHQHGPGRRYADSNSSGDPGIDDDPSSYGGDNADQYFDYRVRQRDTDGDCWNSDVDRYRTGRRDGDSNTCDGNFWSVNCAAVEPGINGGATIARRYFSSVDLSSDVIAAGESDGSHGSTR